MSAAVLPPAANGDVHPEFHVTPNARYASGLILPPPEIKSVIDRTAVFVARSANPPQFEDKIREGQRSDPKFSFLNPADPYHAYYRDKMDKVMQGDMAETQAPSASATPAAGEAPVKVVDVGLEPPPTFFTLDRPNVSALDMDIMKLTALFTARQGHTFLQTLSNREAQNYQYEFLRPTHSLFGYFNRLVEQYTKVLYPDKEMLEQLKNQTHPTSRWTTLEIAKRYAKWERNKREREKRRQDDQEAERIAFAEIDWHDYAIVQTIEFTAVDATSELPPPMTVQEVENMTLAQKRMTAMVMENTASDVEALKARQAAAEAEAAAAAASAGVTNDDVEMDESDDEGAAEMRRAKEQVERQKEIERAKAMASTPSQGGAMKIRTDYVPKLGRNTTTAMTQCNICKQQVPVDELQEHMRIELLNPRWKEQRDQLEARKAQGAELQRGSDVVSSLKNLARTRVDIFGAEADEERRKKDEELERERRKEREKGVWDGHTASKLSTQDKYASNVNFDEQIAAIHRAKGLGPQDAAAIGPGIGPAAAPSPFTSLPPAPASLPAPPRAATAAINNPSFSAATVSSGPQPASAASSTPPVMLPPLHYQGMDSQQPFGYQPPSRTAALAAANSAMQPQAGTVRSADEMEDGAPVDDTPPAKKQKIMKLPGAQICSEDDWINMHPAPIQLSVELPNDPSKPEWKLDGKTVTIVDIPMNLLVSTLRERIIQQIGIGVPVSRIRLSYAGKMMTNGSSIAAYNVEDEELLVLSVSPAKKK